MDLSISEHRTFIHYIYIVYMYFLFLPERRRDLSEAPSLHLAQGKDGFLREPQRCHGTLIMARVLVQHLTRDVFRSAVRHRRARTVTKPSPKNI